MNIKVEGYKCQPAMSNDENIFTALLPCYYLQFFTGNAPFLVVLEHTTVTYLKHNKLYNNLVTTVLLFILISITYILYFTSAINYSNKGIVKLMTLAYWLIVIGFLSVNFICARIYGESMIKLWRKLHDIDIKLRNCGVKMNYKYIKWTSIRMLLIGLTTLTSYVVYLLASQTFADKLRGCMTYGFLYLGILSYTSMTCTFLTVIRSISHMHEGLIKKFQSTYSGTVKTTKKDTSLLRTFLRLHQDICNVLRLANKVFAVQMLTSFAISFVIITFQTYSILCSFYTRTKYIKYAVASVVWILISLIEKFSVTLACHKSMYCTTLTKKSLTKTIPFAEDKSFVNEINAFALQILHEEYKIHAGHFFIIDLPIFTSVCGTVITYIILLLQTDPSVDINMSMKRVFGVF